MAWARLGHVLTQKQEVSLLEAELRATVVTAYCSQISLSKLYVCSLGKLGVYWVNSLTCSAKQKATEDGMIQSFRFYFDINQLEFTQCLNVLPGRCTFVL